MENTDLKGGDNVIVTSTENGWESLIGKPAIVCETNDSTDPEKLKVDFENGFIGYFNQKHLSLNNALNKPERIVEQLNYMVANSICLLKPHQLADIRVTILAELKTKERLTNKIISLETELSILKTND